MNKFWVNGATGFHQDKYLTETFKKHFGTVCFISKTWTIGDNTGDGKISKECQV